MHARLRCSKSLLTLYQIINKTDFPSLADEIAEPHPDMNIKVAAFTVSEKSSNTTISRYLSRPTGTDIFELIIHYRLTVNNKSTYLKIHNLFS